MYLSTCKLLLEALYTRVISDTIDVLHSDLTADDASLESFPSRFTLHPNRSQIASLTVELAATSERHTVLFLA
jgi:hypothetical protein